MTTPKKINKLQNFITKWQLHCYNDSACACSRDSQWTACVCTRSMNELHLIRWLCTAGGRGVLILHVAGWLYSIRWRTKCVVINFLLAHTKLAIWLTRTHSVCVCVCAGVGLLTHFIVHLLAPQGWIFPMCGSRTQWDAVVYDGVCKCWLRVFVWIYRTCSVYCLYLLWNIHLSLFSDLNELVHFRMICGRGLNKKEEVKYS